MHPPIYPHYQQSIKSPLFRLFSLFVFAFSKAATKFRNIMAVSASRTQNGKENKHHCHHCKSAAEQGEKRSADKQLKLRCLDPKFLSRNWKGWARIPNMDGRILQMPSCAMSRNDVKHRLCLAVKSSETWILWFNGFRKHMRNVQSICEKKINGILK